MCIVSLLKETGETLSVAESLTGGKIADAVVSLPGASEVFFGGIVSYTDDVKHRLLGVKRETLESHTAVSAEVAAEMAAGVAARFGTTLAVSATGVAGPGGGTEETPVGCVYLGLYHKGDVSTVRLSLSGSREKIRLESAALALKLVEKELEKPAHLLDKHKSI